MNLRQLRDAITRAHRPLCQSLHVGSSPRPRYHRGTSIVLSLACVMAFFAMFNTLYLVRENRKKSAHVAAMGI
ncbi:hypothetical protein EHS25_004822 [Saitozyma podzolica]|uniref:Uncharacterized protein n=1 Tax=Saitozyma podzolica TaxID=1890683 RepID=A0A427Y2Q5_9TREE|nr:hypothetical protein EHS25_004822 [Saitozyma podzolica]